MNHVLSRHRRLLYCTVLLVCSAVPISALTPIAQDEVAEPQAGDPVMSARQMIDDIANHNQSPELVEIDKDTYPVFPENYDWKEQSRVWEALQKLHQDGTVELWEALVKAVDDQRYSLTVMTGAKSTSDDEWGENYSIGDFCRKLAWNRLVAVYRRHLVRDPRGNENVWRPVWIDVGVMPTTLAQWCKERKDKAFYELQIEVCEQAIAHLPKVENVTDEQRNSMRKAIQAEVEKLKTTRQPMFVKTSAVLDLYHSETAARIRKMVEEVAKSK